MEPTRFSNDDGPICPRDGRNLEKVCDGKVDREMCECGFVNWERECSNLDSHEARYIIGSGVGIDPAGYETCHLCREMVDHTGCCISLDIAEGLAWLLRTFHDKTPRCATRCHVCDALGPFRASQDARGFGR